MWLPQLWAHRAGGKGALLGGRGMRNFITHYSILPWQLVTGKAVKTLLKNEGSMANC